MAGLFKACKTFLMSNCAQDLLVLLRFKRTVCIGILALPVELPCFDHVLYLIDESGLCWVSKFVNLITRRKIVSHEIGDGFFVVEEGVAI